ncbi:MAG TPA: hypothetical protein VM364_20555 [Vicinamibacterales bacterium]|nr:hypothetical protein [Vicinamibacterales bacterium]
MFRTSFVWESQVRRELIEDELTRLRELPYSLWRDVIGQPMRKPVRGRDNRAYQLKTSADWMRPGSENIRVTVALETPTLHRRLMSQSFVITPDNRFRE